MRSPTSPTRLPIENGIMAQEPRFRSVRKNSNCDHSHHASFVMKGVENSHPSHIPRQIMLINITSPEMISMARFLSKHTGGIRDISNFVNAFTETCGDEAKSFVHAFIERTKLLKARFGWSSRPVYAQGNAESTIFADGTFDLVTVFYGFHEIPRLARGRVLQESHRILQDGGKLAIVDISTDYSPSPAMLAGEPYVLEYSKNIHDQMESLKGAGFTEYSYETIVPGHVGLWLLTCEKDTLPQTSL